MEELKKNRINEVLKRVLNSSLEDDKLEEKFEQQFGSRLHLAKGALLIREIGNRLHCSLITVTKAMVLFHKVQRNPKFNTSCLASVACLNLSIKLCDEDVSPDEVVLKSYHTTLDFENSPNPTRSNPSSEVLKDMKENLCLAEYAICRSMAFKLECTLAHMYVYKFLAQLKSVFDASESVIITMSTCVTKLMSTYYLCEGCLDYTPHEIASACLRFTYFYSGIVSAAKNVIYNEVFSGDNKDRISQILDELILVSDVSTTLKPV